MQPSTIPQGALARRAWRALSPQARQAAFAAAGDGAAWSDLHVAWAAAGYGRLVSRRLQVLRMLMPVVALIVMIPLAVVLITVRATPTVVQVASLAVIAVIVGGILGLAAWGRRYQRLYSSGLLAIEAASLRGPAQPPTNSGWDPATADSEFTVPYGAQVPVVAPIPPPVTDPAAAGVHEIPLRRGPILVYLAFMVFVALGLWLMDISLWTGPRPKAILATVVAVGAGAFTVLLLVLLYAVTPGLVRPVIARFAPEGWQLPSGRMSGTWAEVRAIKVRPLSARGSMGGTPQLATIRVVALMVDDPQSHLSPLGPLRRWMVRRNLTKYGSPVIIVATRRTMPVVDLVHLLARYTPAPVEWT